MSFIKFNITEDIVLIEVKNLTKKYGSFAAVKDVSFTIEKGHVYGLLGPNGAGKSTMNIMAGCLAATEGSVTINGYDIYEQALKAKRSVGYLPEIPPLYPDMTPFEYLKFVAKAKKVKGSVYEEIYRVSDITGITKMHDRLIKNLSKGYKQRVGIAQALIGDPEIIILDEPTVGLDPYQLIEVRELISSLAKDHAVILSSHIMGEIAAVCDYIIIMAFGKIIAEGTIEDLEGSREGQTVTVVTNGDENSVKNLLEAIEGAEFVRTSKAGEKIKAVIETSAGYDIRENVFTSLSTAGNIIYELSSTSVSLEDMFIRLTTEAAEREAESSIEEYSEAKSSVASSDYTPFGSPYLADETNADGDTSDNITEEEYTQRFGDTEGGDE